MVEMIIPMEDLGDPMKIRFTFKVTNIDDIPIYVKSELNNPPAGWIETDEQHGVLAVGEDDYFLNDNCTRDKPATDVEENVVLKISYYSDSGYSNLLSTENITYTITYVDFTDNSYVIVDDDTFESGLEDWVKTDEVGTMLVARTTGFSRSGVASMYVNYANPGDVSYISKNFTISNATRAYIRIWLRFAGIVLPANATYEAILELITDVEGITQKRTLPIALDVTPKGGTGVGEQWVCIGAKIPVNNTYEVRLRGLIEDSSLASFCQFIFFDDIRVIKS